MMVGSGYSIRVYCDGQTLASPGKWPVESQNYTRRQQVEDSGRNDYGVLTEVWYRGTPHASRDGTSHGVPVPERRGGLVEKSHYLSPGRIGYPAGKD